MDFLEKLKECRNNPRKMHKKYLESIGILSFIENSIPYEDFKIKEKIDIIISGWNNTCYCGRLSKFESKWCSIRCRNRDPEIRKSIADKNSSNKVSRAEAMKNTLLERYGVDSIQKIPSVQAKTKIKKNSYYNKVIEDTFNRYGLDKSLLSDHEYLRSICNNKSAFEVMRENFNNIPYTTMIRHFERIGFDPKFKDGSSSHGEKELYNWIVSIIPNEEIITNGRKLLDGKELDIFIPNKKLAIEYNGLYWHSESKISSKGNDGKLYHYDKFILAKSKGVQLLQFFEDEWETKKDIVKSIIKSKLGLFDKILYARKCSICYVENKVAYQFLEENHLQGKISGKHLGLFFDGELVSMITVGKSRFKSDIYELYRFVSKSGIRVIGGLSRLIKKIKIDIGCNTIDTYADMRYSDGKSYKTIGKYIGKSDPGYYWTKKKLRLNRFSTQKHKLKDLLGSEFNPSESESQNMERCGWYKIYDCGNLVFSI